MTLALDWLPRGALRNIGSHRLHLRMDPAVGCEELAVTWMIRLAGKIGDHSSGFLHKQHPRSRIPGLQAEFPESFEAARRDPAKIKRRRPVTPDAVRSKRETGVVSDIRLLAALIRRKSCDEQAGGQRIDLRNVDAFVV